MEEDPYKFLDGIYKIVDSMRYKTREKAEFASIF